VRLMLPVCRRKITAQLTAEKFDCEGLVRSALFESHQQYMYMIRHQHIGWNNELVTGARMKNDKLPLLMKGVGQPSGGAILER
jgi:hypothetical protein